MHSTSNLDDDYIGSGQRLWKSIKKHGRDKHTKEILEFLEDRSSLKKREAELVNKDTLKDLMCMNLQTGGGGGFSGETHLFNFIKNGENTRFSERWKDPEFKKNKSIEAKERYKILKALGKFGNFHYDWTGRKHRPETKIKVGKANSINQLGQRNSQFGTMFIYSDSLKLSKRIKKSNLENELIGDWKIGRKMKF
jgi:hypothetical protein